MSSLSDLVTALSTVRNTLVSNLNAKGLSLPAAATIMECAAAISEIDTGGGYSGNFYRCASVDTANYTWTGYKAVQDPTTGIYNFESTVTSGLTYSVVTPEVGKVYADGALVEAKLYTGIPDDMVLHIPMASSSPSAETGQPLSFNGSGFNFGQVGGIPCCYFSGAGYIDVNLGDTSGMPTGNLTLSYWIKFTGTDFGIPYAQQGMHTGADSTSLSLGNYTQWGIGATTDTSEWHHFAVTRNSDTIIVYLDGVSAGADTKSLNVDGYLCYIGVHPDGQSYPFVGYLAGLRVYDRALTAVEIAALAAEFTPSTSASNNE